MTDFNGLPKWFGDIFDIINYDWCSTVKYTVGKNSAKLERTRRSWKEPSEVRKFLLKLESFAEVGKFRCSWKVLAEVGKFK